MTHRRFASALGVVLALLLFAAAGLLIKQACFPARTITAWFTSATGIYPGDKVQVAGVTVGRIASIEPAGTQTKFTLEIDRGIPLPADVRAVIVAQSLVAARTVQLAPAYADSGPTLPDRAVIPVERTAVPVEWDEVKTQLMRLATDLGPTSEVSTPGAARFIDSAANAMAGNGDKLRETLNQLSGVGRILADGGGDLAAIISNLQSFVTALSGSNEQIVQFQDRLATLTSVLNNNRPNLDAALNELSVAIGEVDRFVAETRDPAAEQVQRLVNVTQNLVDHRKDLEQVLHIAPNAFGNFYNIYHPGTGSPIGVIGLNNFSNPMALVCAMVGAVENVTSADTGKRCAEYLGPALRLLNFNYVPVPLNALLMPSARPEDIIYSPPDLAPGGAGPAPGPAEQPPAVSAFVGSASPPEGSAPPSTPDPPPPVTGLPDLLLPAERPTP